MFLTSPSADLRRSRTARAPVPAVAQRPHRGYRAHLLASACRSRSAAAGCARTCRRPRRSRSRAMPKAARRARNADDAAAIAGESAGHVYGLKSDRRADRGPRRQHHALPGDRPRIVPAVRPRSHLADGVHPRPARRAVQVLEPFARRGISMNRIESRPAHSGLWQYAFFIDVGGHAEESPLQRRAGGGGSDSPATCACWARIRSRCRDVTAAVAPARDRRGFFLALAQPGIQRLRAYDPGHDLVALRRDSPPAHLVELGSNENPYGPSPRRARRVLERTACVASLSRSARRRPQARAGRSITASPPAQSLLGNGSHELLMQFAQVFAGPGVDVVRVAVRLRGVCDRGAGGGRDAAAGAGAAARARDGARPRSRRRCLPRSRPPRAWSIWPIRTTRPAPGSRRTRSPRSSVRVPRDVIVVVDEAYAELVDAPDFASALHAPRRASEPRRHPHLQQGLRAGRLARRLSRSRIRA